MSRLKTAFSNAFSKYDAPHEYLRELMADEGLPRATIFRLFVKISYRILNRDGFEVSGGERSEFRLLQEIADAQNFDILLIDEPESSFDNLFLKSDVNSILKGISETMPVVVVTHNSTVRASIGADYLLLTKVKRRRAARPSTGCAPSHPTDKAIASLDGEDDCLSRHSYGFTRSWLCDLRGAGSRDMMLLKIDDNSGYFLDDKRAPSALIDKIGKEDLLRLVNLTLEEHAVEFDEFDDKAIKNQSPDNIYKSVFQKLRSLRDRRQEFIDESARLYLEEFYEVYRNS